MALILFLGQETMFFFSPAADDEDDVCCIIWSFWWDNQSLKINRVAEVIGQN